jgi:hypothetical protein
VFSPDVAGEIPILGVFNPHSDETPNPPFLLASFHPYPDYSVLISFFYD